MKLGLLGGHGIGPPLPIKHPEKQLYSTAYADT
jgi:hypothetical protein